MITDDLATHIESGVSMIVASRDSGLRPDCVRALGARVDPGGETLTIFLPVAVAGRTVANLADNGRLAATFSRICDHHTVQLKGVVTAVARADAEERHRVDRYRSALAAELDLAGLPEHVVFRVRHWPCFAVTLRPDSLFDQTPGPSAGELVRSARTGAAMPADLEAEVSQPAATVTDLERLDDACFQGLLPSLLATCDRDGEPNVTYLSQVYALDRDHVALSCQFFNKTKRNLLEHPFSSVQLYHPLSFQAWRLQLRFLREEKEGPLFDSMSTRIDVIASHTGMAGIFRLLSADVHEVLSVERLDDFLLPDPLPPTAVAPLPPGERLGELRGLQSISARIAGASGLDGVVDTALAALDELLGLGTTMVLRADSARRRLVVLGCHGYDSGACGVAAQGMEVLYGAGVIGAAADSRRIVRMAGVGSGLAYGRAIRGQVETRSPERPLQPQVGLPGLADAQAQLALPMLVGCELVGVLVAESRDPLAFDEWDEAFLQIVANQIGARLHSSLGAVGITTPEVTDATSSTVRRFALYRDADTVFLDGEYLVRGVAARILWKILGLRADGRAEITNRELRLDPSLGLPKYRDNLESRLVLLRKRLEERCSDVRLVSVKRGRLALESDSPIELEVRDG